MTKDVYYDYDFCDCRVIISGRCIDCGRVILPDIDYDDDDYDDDED